MDLLLLSCFILARMVNKLLNEFAKLKTNGFVLMLNCFTEFSA